MMLSIVLAFGLAVVSAGVSNAQTANGSPSGPVAGQAPGAFAETVQVVGVAPIHGLGIAVTKVPTAVQSFGSEEIARLGGLQLSDALTVRLSSVTASDPQSNPFQPDLQFRGFMGSPLLGSSQGLTVYQDGVRLNEPFGDTVQWNLLLPPNAIASVNLMPGSNPLFGLNTLGGALSIQTKDGFANAAQRAVMSAGSFGRAWADVESGGARGNVSYFVSGRWLREDGWRDYSPSRMGQLFGNVGWRGDDSTSVNLSVTGGATRLRGNGPLPVQLLEEDRRAVFTHPDMTEIDYLSVNARAARIVHPDLALNGVAYYRPATFDTFNGDDTNYEPCGDDPGVMCIDGHRVVDEFGTIVRTPADSYDATDNRSRTRTHGYGAAAQLTFTRPFASRDNQLIAGGSLDAGRASFESSTELARLDATRGTRGSGLIDGDSLVNLDTRVAHLGAYAANFLTVSPRVTLSASARFTRSAVVLRDRIGTELSGDHTFHAVNPAAGLAVGLSTGITAFASYSSSSRVPTPSELGCADPDDPCRLPNAFVSDPPLKPVVARTLEGGVRGRHARHSWSATAFRTVNRDDLLFISSGALSNEGFFANVGDTVRSGIELNATGTRGRLHWTTSYTLLDAIFGTPIVVSSRNHPDAVGGEIAVDAGDRLPGIPRHSLKLDVDWSGPRASAGVSTQYTSSQFLRGDEANSLDPIARYFVANVRGKLVVNRRATLVVQVANLFDSRHQTFGLLGEADDVLGDAYDDPRFLSPAAPRAMWVGIELSFGRR